jgi:hypothetical protein
MSTDKVKLDKAELSKIRKKARASGAKFEIRCREELEAQGWVVAKWSNNIDIEKEIIIKAKPKFNPFTKTIMMNSSGFPDLIAFRLVVHEEVPGLVHWPTYHIRFVECKKNGYLTQEEKKKCQILTKLTGVKVEVMKDEKR